MRSWRAQREARRDGGRPAGDDAPCGAWLASVERAGAAAPAQRGGVSPAGANGASCGRAAAPPSGHEASRDGAAAGSSVARESLCGGRDGHGWARPAAPLERRLMALGRYGGPAEAARGGVPASPLLGSPCQGPGSPDLASDRGAPVYEGLPMCIRDLDHWPSLQASRRSAEKFVPPAGSPLALGRSPKSAGLTARPAPRRPTLRGGVASSRWVGQGLLNGPARSGPPAAALRAARAHRCVVSPP